MSSFDYFVIATLLLVTIISVITGILYRNRFNRMSGMMVSMVISMNVGLTAGLLLGSNYQGNLYLSTIISILVGVIAGTACGMTFGVLPTLEGFMAGLMGGMMGAMLGEMITQNQADTIINIFLALTVCSLLLFPILYEPNGKEINNKKRFWFVKPLFVFLFLLSYLMIGNKLDKQIILSKFTPLPEDFHTQINNENMDHSNHGSSKSSEETQEIVIKIHETNFSYDPEKIVLKKGQQVRLMLTNNDTIEHDIEIMDFPATIKTEVKHEGHQARDVDFHLHANPKSKTEAVFTPLEKGTYEFYCTIPGHKDSGMTGIIMVN